jgi:hypothetical protein
LAALEVKKQQPHRWAFFADPIYEDGGAGGGGVLSRPSSASVPFSAGVWSVFSFVNLCEKMGKKYREY